MNVTCDICSNWMEKVPGGGKSAKCKFYKKVIQLSNMGEGALISYTGGDKHQKKIADLKRMQTCFANGSSRKSTSKALSETSSITTITDAVDVISSNSQKTPQKLLTVTFSLLKSVKLTII